MSNDENQKLGALNVHVIENVFSDSCIFFSKFILLTGNLNINFKILTTFCVRFNIKQSFKNFKFCIIERN